MSSYFEAMSRLRNEVPAVRPTPSGREPVRSRRRRPEAPTSGHVALRESLLAQSNGHQLRTIVFAGCEGGEGCTRLVGDLARLLADSGLYVLLVDGNARAKESLTGWRHAQDVVEVVPVEPVATSTIIDLVDVDERRLTIARSPAAVRDKERLFLGGEFARWLGRHRDAYDYVLIDGPPLLRFADSIVMGRESDGLVLVVAAGWTGKRNLVRAHRKLERAQVNVIGAVVNGVSDPIPAALQKHFAFVRE
jgi:succinoglycan biosynthesis transport protein ExoP